MFLGSLVVLVAGTASLFAGRSSSSSPASRWSAALASAAVAGAVAAIGIAAGVTGTNAVLFAIAFIAVASLWLRATRDWNVRGHLTWTAYAMFAVSYLAYMLVWTFTSDLGVVGLAGGLLLWVLEAGAFALGLMYGWELVDVLARRRWRRRCLADGSDASQEWPFVSLHVPAYNEPPEMVIATLESLLAIDYPAFEIVMIDDNTTDEALWRPVEAFCRQHAITFHHLADWPGYKSGALNFALTVTSPRAEVIGVVDADYLVQPDYLRRCAPLFAQRPALGFLQTPQDYREWEGSAYYRRLYYSYDYFFAVSQASRNERNGAIFGGTMGLIRRAALVETGGWDEWCITEDAELSLRILRAGWEGQHVEQSFGRGVMPLSFEALKRQRFRWCFGGVQILRKHWRSLMPWDRTPDNHLTPAQRYDYLAGGLQWFGDLLAVVFAALLLIGALNLSLGGGFTFRRIAGAVLVVPPLLIAVGVGRSVGLLRRQTGASLRDAAGALRMWLSLGLTVAKACALGVVRSEGVFMRTPKVKGEGSWQEAVRTNRAEVAFAVVLVASIPVTVLRAPSTAAAVLAVLLGWHAIALLLAPAQSFAALHADLPPELRRLRRSEWLRERLSATKNPLRIGAMATTCIAALLAGITLFAPHAPTGTSAAPRDPFSEARGARPDDPARDAPQHELPAGPATTTDGSTPTTAEPAGPGRSLATSTPAGVAPTVTTSPVAAPTSGVAQGAAAVQGGGPAAASTSSSPAVPTTTRSTVATPTTSAPPVPTSAPPVSTSTPTSSTVPRGGPPSSPTTRPHP